MTLTIGFYRQMLPNLTEWQNSPPEGTPKLLVISSGIQEANKETNIMHMEGMELLIILAAKTMRPNDAREYPRRAAHGTCESSSSCDALLCSA
jgi:hypothetical protein